MAAKYEEMSIVALTEVYNELVAKHGGGKPIKKFATKAVAVKRVTELIESQKIKMPKLKFDFPKPTGKPVPPRATTRKAEVLAMLEAGATISEIGKIWVKRDQVEKEEGERLAYYAIRSLAFNNHYAITQLPDGVIKVA